MKDISDNTFVFRSEEVFNKINFKMYKLEGHIIGEIYHTHDYMQIWYVRKGVLIHWLNKVPYKLTHGDVFILPPYVAHRTRTECEDTASVIGFEFSSRFFDMDIADFTGDKQSFAYLEPFLVSEEIVKPRISLSADAAVMVERLLDEMYSEYTKEETYYELMIKAGILKLLAMIARELNNTHDKNFKDGSLEKYREAITNAITFINENYDRPIKLEDAYKKAALSKTYFCHLFKYFTNKTFSDYLTNVRIQKAMRLLTDTDQTIASICCDIGFNDITHFCRTFKKNVGVSPNFYRKENS